MAPADGRGMVGVEASMLDEGHLVVRIADDVGAGRTDEARRALLITLEALAGSLAHAEVEALADELPAHLAAAVRRGGGRRGVSADPFGDVAAREGVPRALAIEYAHVACQALAASLGDEVRAMLARALAPPWRELFHEREASAPPPPPHHAPPVGEGHTLATGRPGSHHAVADHGIERAQADSVVRQADPHEGDKLSSGSLGGEPLADSHDHPHPRHVDEADG